jgi:hypothetical protein
LDRTTPSARNPRSTHGLLVARPLATRLLVAALLVASALGRLDAQPLADAKSSVGVDRVETRRPLGLRIENFLGVRVLGAPVVVSRTPEAVEVEVRVETVANLRWTLAVTVDAGTVEVQDESQAWVPAIPGVPIHVVGLAQATNPRVTVVRLRVLGRETELAAARGLFQISPAVTPGQGAVSVSWTGTE